MTYTEKFLSDLARQITASMSRRRFDAVLRNMQAYFESGGELPIDERVEIWLGANVSEEDWNTLCRLVEQYYMDSAFVKEVAERKKLDRREYMRVYAQRRRYLQRLEREGKAPQ